MSDVITNLLLLLVMYNECAWVYFFLVFCFMVEYNKNEAIGGVNFDRRDKVGLVISGNFFEMFSIMKRF